MESKEKARFISFAFAIDTSGEAGEKVYLSA
jgi:hypothetical protein